MRLLEELLPGCWLIEPKVFRDVRGEFVKTMQESFLVENGLNFKIREEFYSSSRSGVLRGMHFQRPPHDHNKFVTCVSGEVLDVLVDIRKGNSYGRIASTKLSAENAHCIYIPSGIAHGFLAISDDSLMLYKTSSEYSQSHDDGIHWNSFSFDWGIVKPIVSNRDESHSSFLSFQTPF